MTYIKGEKPSGCILCQKSREKKDRRNLVLSRSTHSFTLMNLYPYNNGHLMISPYQHADSPELLSDETWSDLTAGVRTAVRVLKKACNPDGLNVGLNLGKAAGAGIDDHLHFHVVPRWGGDTNFMTVVSEVRVIPERLEETYRLLKPLFR
jgi:ATP adenylyltransferase